MTTLSASPAAVRAQRAQEQVNNYGLFAHPTANVFSVVSREGKVYETTATTCTCPDFTHRGSKQNPPVPCKHQHLVRAQAEEARVAIARAAIIRAEQAVAARQAQEAANADLQARLAAARRRIAQDFPEG